MSHTNLVTINSTEINNSGPIRIGDDLSSGTAGQVLKSQGDDLPPEWGSGGITYTAGSGISIVGTSISTKPSLPLSNSAGNIILNYASGQAGLVVSAGQLVLNPDTTTLGINGSAPHYVEVLKVPNALTAGTNISLSSGTTYDGSSALTISSTNTDTTYTSGDNLNLSGTTFNLDSSIEDMRDITYESGFFATTLTGNDYPGSETTCTYLDLTSTTNKLPAAASPFLATKIQQTYLIKTITTAYAEYSTNFRTSFVAQSANVMVEFRAVIRADNRVLYGGLYDYNTSKFWTTPQTQNRFNFNDETDQDFTTLTWWINGLTPGNTYYVTPYFRSNSNYSYIYAGNSGTADNFAPGVFRIIDGGSSVNTY